MRSTGGPSAFPPWLSVDLITGQALNPARKHRSRGRSIVLLNQGPGPRVESLAERVQQLIGQRATVQLFEHLDGFTARLNRHEISSLMARGVVLAIADDDTTMLLEAAGKKKRRRRSKKQKRSAGERNPLASISAIDSGVSVSSSSDILPWGTKLVLDNRDPSSMIERAGSKYVFVMDTGISSTTGDLNVRTEWGYNFISPGSSAEDDNGHGTHMAGTIGAMANNIGIVGVAPGVNLIPYKVLDNNGSGSLSTVVAAINRMLDTIASQQLNPRDVVVNLSFGSRGQDPIIQAAISKATALGVRFAIAAGNYSNDIDGGEDSSPFMPASYGNPEAGVFVTSAINSSLQMAGFSNYDRISNPGDIDNIGFTAPGEKILSWYRRADGSFGLYSLSGTSMAAAHLSGLLLLGEISAGPMASANGAVAPDPIALLAAAPI